MCHLLPSRPSAFEEHAAHPRGGEVRAPVELRDILPTLLDAAHGVATPRARAPLRVASPRASGAPPDAERETPSRRMERERPLVRMDGRSLLELLRRAAPRRPAARRALLGPSSSRAAAPSSLASASASACPVLELGDPSPPWREWIGLEHDQLYSQRNHWSALTDGATKCVGVRGVRHPDRYFLPVKGGSPDAVPRPSLDTSSSPRRRQSSSLTSSTTRSRRATSRSACSTRVATQARRRCGRAARRRRRAASRAPRRRSRCGDSAWSGSSKPRAGARGTCKMGGSRRAAAMTPRARTSPGSRPPAGRSAVLAARRGGGGDGDADGDSGQKRP